MYKQFLVVFAAGRQNGFVMTPLSRAAAENLLQATRLLLLSAHALTIIVATVGYAATIARAENEPRSKRVLVIYSDERLVPANVIEDEAIRKTFAKDPAYRVEFYSEFLDVARFGSEAHAVRQADFFQQKYAERPPDLIICAGQAALTFLVNHRSTLSTEVPVVAHGAIEQRVLEDVPDPRIVGVPNPPRFTSTLELALALHPQAQEVAVVAGATPRDRVFADTARRALEPFKDRLRIRWLTNQSIEALKGELASLSDQTVVLYVTLFGDGSGNSFLPPQALEQFAPASRAPI